MERLLSHLLKWLYQPEMRCNSWEKSISGAREALIEAPPSIRAQIDDVILKVYPAARRWALAEMKMTATANIVPEQCPFTTTQIVDDDFLPGIEQ